MNVNNLVFFDKNGESYNFSQNSAGYWEGADYFLPVSTALFDCSNIFILENTNGIYTYPKLEEDSKLEIIWKTADSSDNFFIFTVRLEGTGSNATPFINKKDSITINYSDFGQSSGDLNLTYPLQLNVAFTPTLEKAYSRVMQMYYTNSIGTTQILELTFYGEGEDEDERFGVWLQNFGIKFNREDALILKEYDLKESLVDWKKVNEARKNLLVNKDQVFPYIGTYKGLLNIIDLMGYKDVLRVKEYWRDSDQNSSYYNKFAMVDITDIMQIGDISTLDLIDEHGQIKKGGKFRKTEFLALAYEFTIASDNYDDDGLPEVIETTEFTVNEIFFKLHGLAKKLKNEILPINVIIKDIIGEFIYFEKFNLRNWSDDTHVEDLLINDVYKVKVLQPDTTSLDLKIRDIKTLYSKYNGISLFPEITFNTGQVEPYQDNQYYPSPGIADLRSAITDYYETIKYYDFHTIGQSNPINIGDDNGPKIGCPVILEAYVQDLTLQDLDGITFGDFIITAPTSSSSSNTLGLGSKVFSCVTVQPFNVGSKIKIYVSTDSHKFMEGTVTAVNQALSQITVTVTQYNGFGTFTGWTITLIDMHYTIGNLKYKNAYEIEWNIDGPNYHFEWRDRVANVAKIPHILPHTGEYTIGVKVYDLQGGTSLDYSKVTVKSQEPILQGFVRLQDKFKYTFKNLDNITLGDVSSSPLYDLYANVINASGEAQPLASIATHYLDWYTYSNRFGIGGRQDEIQIYDDNIGYEDYSVSNSVIKERWGTGSANGQPTLLDYENALLGELYHLDFAEAGYVGDTLDGFQFKLKSLVRNSPDAYITSMQFGGYSPLDVSAVTLTPFPIDILNILNSTTLPGWSDYRYQMIGSLVDPIIKATAKYQQKKNHSIIKIVSTLAGSDINENSYIPNYTNTTVTPSTIGSLGDEYVIAQTVISNNEGFFFTDVLAGDRIRICNPIGQWVEGYINVLVNEEIHIIVDEINNEPQPSSPYDGLLSDFVLSTSDHINTFCRPRDVFDTHTLSEVQSVLYQAGFQIDEDLLFLNCPFEDKLKMSAYPFTPAPASNINYWIDKEFIVYDNSTGEQTGFLPSSYDENAFTLINLKASYDSLIVPINHPVLLSISNLISNVEVEWTLMSGSVEVGRVKTPSYFIWRFEDAGNYQLHVKSTDARQNISETTVEITAVRALTPGKYAKHVEKLLNDRKLIMTGL